MNGRLRALAFATLVVAIGLLSSGCYLRLLFGTLIEYVEPGESTYQGTIEAEGWVAACSNRAVVAPVPGGGFTYREYSECDYFVGTGEGKFEQVTSSSQLIEEYGLYGVFIDPLVVQLPGDATNIRATFDDGSGPRPAVVSTPEVVRVTPGGRSISPEPGSRLAILEFPPDVIPTIPAGDARQGKPFDLRLDFELDTLRPVEVKVIFTIKQRSGAFSYYLPMLPCTSVFAQVPALTVAVSAQPVDLLAQAAELAAALKGKGCDDEVYDLRGAGAGNHRSFAAGAIRE